MAFDPDKYLEGNEKAFDPDAYLGGFDPDAYLGSKRSTASNVTRSLATGAAVAGYGAAEGLAAQVGTVIAESEKYDAPETQRLKELGEALAQVPGVNRDAVHRSWQPMLMGDGFGAQTYPEEYDKLPLEQKRAVDKIYMEAADLRGRREERVKKRLEDSPLLAAADANRDLKRFAREYYGVDEAFAESLPGMVTEGVGGLGFYIPMGMAGPLGVAAMQSSLFSEGVEEYRQFAGEAYDAREALRIGLAYSLPATALERTGLDAILGRVFKAAGKQTLKQVGKRLAVEGAQAGLTEGLTESMQGLWQSFVAKQSYDPDRDLLSSEELGKRWKQFLVGTLVGTGARTVIGGAAAVDTAKAEKAAAAKEPLPVADEPTAEGQEAVDKENLTTEAAWETSGDGVEDILRLKAAVPTEARSWEPDYGAIGQPQERGADEWVGPPPPEVRATGEVATYFDLTQNPVLEVPLKTIKLSKDVPQFKEDANAQTGETEPLEGTQYVREPVSPILVWQRMNGDMEVITGRHRLALARRLGEATIPAQVVREADGFNRDMALTVDAEANIRDGQGSVKDYASYFKNTKGLTREQAESRGLLSRAKGQAGWHLGKDAEASLWASYANRKLSEGKAVAIARGAPGNDTVQRAAITRAKGLDAEALEVLARQLVYAQADAQLAGVQTDLFGADDSAIVEAEKIAKAAGKRLRKNRERLRAVKGAAKRPEVAAEMGVDISDPGALGEEIARLEQENLRLRNPDADMLLELRGEALAGGPHLKGWKSQRANYAEAHGRLPVHEAAKELGMTKNFLSTVGDRFEKEDNPYFRREWHHYGANARQVDYYPVSEYMESVIFWEIVKEEGQKEGNAKMVRKADRMIESIKEDNIKEAERQKALDLQKTNKSELDNKLQDEYNDFNKKVKEGRDKFSQYVVDNKIEGRWVYDADANNNKNIKDVNTLFFRRKGDTSSNEGFIYKLDSGIIHRIDNYRQLRGEALAGNPNTNPIRNKVGGLDAKGAAFVKNFFERLRAASPEAFARLTIRALDEAQWRVVMPAAMQDRVAVYHYGRGMIYFRQGDPRLDSSTVVSFLVHEAGHFADDFYIPKAVSQEAWERLSHEQRLRVWQDYTGSVEPVSEAALKENVAAKREWVAYQFARLVRGDGAVMKEVTPAPLLDKLQAWLAEVRALVRDFVGTADTADAALDTAIAQVLQYGEARLLPSAAQTGRAYAQQPMGLGVGGELGKPLPAGVQLPVPGDPRESRLVFELPELVEVARLLAGGTYPQVRRQLQTALGRFYPDPKNPRIQLKADIFALVSPEEKLRLMERATDQAAASITEVENLPLADYKREVDRVAGMIYETELQALTEQRMQENPKVASKVLAHEIGHWIDWLPDKVLKRGNVLGHIAALTKYTKRLLAELPQGKTEVTEAEVLKELTALNAWWSGVEALNSYMLKPAELYADAMSVWLNNPEALRMRAPIFNRLIENWLEKRPDFAKLYETMQDKIKRGEVHAERVERLRDAFKKVDREGILLEVANAPRYRDYEDSVRIWLDRKAGAIYRRLDKKNRQSAKVHEALGNFIYRGAEHELYLSRVNAEIVRPLAELDVDWQDFGEYLFHRRVQTERRDIANPLGFSPKQSAERLQELADKLGPERYARLYNLAAHYRTLYEETVLARLREYAIFDDKFLAELEQRVFYVTFKVGQDKGLADPDSIEGAVEAAYGPGVGAKIYKQFGTLKAIANPATATLQKALSLTSMAIREKAKRETVEYLLQTGEAIKAQMQFAQRGGFRGLIPVEKTSTRIGTLTFVHQGKLQAYYVPRAVADFFETDTPLMNAATIGLAKVNGFIKGLWTQFCYAFWPVAAMRDVQGWVLQNQSTNANFRELMKVLGPSLKAAWTSVYGQPNDIAQKALKRKLLIARGNRLVEEDATEIDALEYTLKRYGIQTAKAEEVNTLLDRLVKVWHGYSRLGEVSERAFKIAGMLYLDKRRPNMPEWKKQELVRERFGSPAFLQRGKGNVLMDSFVGLYYNAVKEGLRSFAKGWQEAPGRTTWAYTRYAMPLTIGMYMLSKGLLPGLDDDEREDYRAQMAAIPDYFKTNYIVIPLGWADKSQGKAKFLSLPLFEGWRLIHALTWKTIQLADEGKVERAQDIAAFGAGMFPTSAPMMDAGAAWWAYLLEGRNPYDDFRGREIIPNDKFLAGASESVPVLAKWTWNTLGGGIIYRFRDRRLEDGEPTELESGLETPVVGNLIGRWLRVSNRGIQEQVQAISAEVEQERAILRLAANEMLRKQFAGEPFTDEERQAMLQHPYMVEYFVGRLKDLYIAREANPAAKLLLDASSVQARERLAEEMIKGEKLILPKQD